MKYIQTFPKIELHCHLDGSVRPETLKTLALELNLIQPADLDRFDSLIRVPDNCDSLVTYLKCFSLPIAVMQTAEHLERIACELVEDAAATGVKYIEVRFAPHFHMAQGLDFDSVVTSVLKGLGRGEAQTGTLARLILCCMRHLPVEKSLEVVEMGYPYLGRGVVAVDLAGDEHNYPPELHEAAFKRAKELGYKITIHAGETGIGANVSTAVNHLFADRIGHGLFIKDDPAAYALVKANQVPLEMCPTSNLQTMGIAAYKDHPILRFLQDGLATTVNTDNMTVSATHQTAEYQHLQRHLNLTLDQAWRLYENGIDAAFATEAEKDHLRSFLPKVV